MADVEVQVGAADRRGGQPHDGVGGFLQARLRQTVFQADGGADVAVYGFTRDGVLPVGARPRPERSGPGAGGTSGGRGDAHGTVALDRAQSARRLAMLPGSHAADQPLRG